MTFRSRPTIPRRRLLDLACAAAFALASIAPAFAQAVIEGRLVNGTDPRIKPKGAEIEVIQLGGGMTLLKSGVSDAEGRFRLDGIPTTQPLLVRANYLSVNYHGRPSFDTAGKATLEITVYEVTDRFEGIRVQDVRLGFQIDGEHLRVLEAHTVVNETRPQRSFLGQEGSFRFSKPAGIEQVPQLTVTGPGAPMPLQQSPLESADGTSYYSLFPLRPGKTIFEVQYALPYRDRALSFRKTFYRDVPSYQIGVSPHDMTLAGPGLERTHADTKRNFAIYSGAAVKAGTELVWSFSGGTAQSSEEPSAGESKIKPAPTEVGRNALVIGPLLLAALLATLWYAHNRVASQQQKIETARNKELRARREALLERIAGLDDRFEREEIGRREYARMRDQWKRQLRRVATLLGKK